MAKKITVSKHLLKERYRLSHHGWFYAIQRIDLLIVAVSGAGIYVGLEVLKFSVDHELRLLWLIKSSGIILVLSITLNLLSQMTGKRTNKHDMIMCSYELSAGNKPSKSDKCEIEKHNDLSERYSGYTRTLNLLSLIFMGIGLGAIVIFFAVTF